MGSNREPDFSGWATKNDLKCSDGRTIKSGAFKHQDKMTVPLVWMHQHYDAENVLGHAVLEDRAFGVYAYGFFNGSDRANHMKHALKNKDVTTMSIFANNLSEQNKNVLHGDIKEVSLVLAGANPGAVIENVNLVHGDTFETLDDEAIIHTGLDLDFDPESLEISHAEGDTNVADTDVDEKTVKDIFDSFDEDQKNVVYYMIGEALESANKDDDDNDGDDDNVEHDNLDGDAVLAHIDTRMKEGFEEMTRNVFEQNGASASGGSNTLTHDQFRTIVEDAQKNKGMFQDSVLSHAAEYGIDDISLLFPDAKTISNSPELISRRMEWVAKVLSGTKHSPFAKVKSLTFDITAEDARAKGYIKGTQKKDEVVKLLRRTTGPTTVYKKQKLDRDDLIDITDMDVVAWLKAEIRMMLEEEIARAILFGDGRDSLSDDKIKDPEGAIDGTGIRSILHDAELYSIKVELPANIAPKSAVKELVRARSRYRGTGKPTLFVSDSYLTDIMLEEDKFGRALYETEQVLADKLRVSEIITVDLIDDTEDLLAIMVNLTDYTIGANKGGELTSFEDFDIDFNQHKYLTETRISGALTKPFSAIVIKRATGTSVTPEVPSFEDNTITIPNTTGVLYTIDGDVVTDTVDIEEDTTVEAVADEGYYIPSGKTTSWAFTYTE